MGSLSAGNSSSSSNAQETRSFSFPRDDDFVDDGRSSHEDVKDENVVSSDFHRICEVNFAYLPQAKTSASSKFVSFFLWESLF